MDNEIRIDVTRSSMPPIEEYFQEIAPLWESHRLTNMGAKHREFESSLESYLGVQNVRLFTNGHTALECMLEVMGLKGKVITTPFTFASTTHAIVRKGLKPVFADIRKSDLTINPESVERLVDDDTCAILPVHVYGCPCDVDALQEIANQYSLKLLYDAAHAFGVEYNGTPICAYGDASMLSFHATKVFNTVEGGAVCFANPELALPLEHCRNFGIEGPEDVEYAGGNAKMDELRAAMGICNLRHIDDEIALRKHADELYRERLEGLRGTSLPTPAEGTKWNYAYFPILFEEGFGASRDDVAAALAKRGIYARKYFYPLVSTYACYRNSLISNDTPVALDAAACVLTLPMYAGLGLDEIDMICNTILECRN